MVHTFAACTQQLPDPLTDPSVMEGLPQERREKILRCKVPESRMQSLGAGLLLREVLARYGVSMDTLRVGADGKPQAEGLCFNLSHSGDTVVCAAAQQPVGCDVEQLRTASEKVIRRFFATGEIQYLQAFSGKDLDREFCRIWTMKESYVKMTGEGMRLAFDRFEVVPGAHQPGAMSQEVCSPDSDSTDIRKGTENIISRVFRDGVTEDCFIREYVFPGYRVSVCASENSFADSIEVIRLI